MGKQAPDDDLIPISRLRAWGLLMFGPADCWDHPLTGTRYDPAVRQRADQARRAVKREVRAAKLRSRWL
jgi:hypothetical protein